MAEPTDIYFRTVPEAGSRRPRLPASADCLLAVSPPDSGARVLSGVSSIGALIPSWGSTLMALSHPRGPPPHTTALESGVQVMKFGETQTFRL